MRIENPTAVQRRYLEGLGLGTLVKFEIPSGEYVDALAEVNAQHPEEDHDERAARAVARVAWRHYGPRELTAEKEQRVQRPRLALHAYAEATGGWAVWAWRLALLLGVWLIFGVLAAHGQIDVLRVKDEGTTIKTWGGGLAEFDFTGGGITCTFGGGKVTCNVPTGGGGASLDAITAALGTSTINNGDNAIIWNWSLTTAGKTAFKFGENVASTATGDPVLLAIATLAASTAHPFQVTSRGTANGIRVGATDGVLGALGTGGVDWLALLNYPAACVNQFIRGLADSPTCATVVSADVDKTSFGATTWGANVDFTWTFDSSGATNPGLTFSGSNINVSTGGLQVAGNSVETQNNKNVASGYAGLDAGVKLLLAHGQEVWSATDLTTYSATSGSGTTALRATITAVTDNQCITFDAATSNWVNENCPGGGIPGGAATNVQFNTAGAFDGDPEFTWDTTNKTLTLGTGQTIQRLALVADFAALAVAGQADSHRFLLRGQAHDGTAARAVEYDFFVDVQANDGNTSRLLFRKQRAAEGFSNVFAINNDGTVETFGTGATGLSGSVGTCAAADTNEGFLCFNSTGNRATWSYNAGAHTNFLLDSDIAATGFVSRTGSGTYTARTITGTTNQLTVTNGDGIAGNPVLNVGSDVVQIDQSNTYGTGTQSFRNAIALLSAGATGTPPATGCDTAAEVGSFYTRLDANSTNATLYVCAQTSATPTFAWELAGGGGGPAGATYVVMSLDGALTAERTLAAGAGLALTDGGANGNVTLATDSTEAAFLADGGVTSLVCGAGAGGKAQVLDGGNFEWCDGAATSILQTALRDPGSNGLLSRTALGTVTPRSIAGTASEIAVANADGTGGNPTLSLDATVAQTDVAKTFTALQTFRANTIEFTDPTDTSKKATASLANIPAATTRVVNVAGGGNSTTVVSQACTGTDKISSISADGAISCTSDQSAGTGGPNFATSFTAQTSVTVLGTAHNLGSKNLLVACYDNASPAKNIGCSWTVDATTNDVVVTFAASQSGYLTINGSGPTRYAESFTSITTLTVAGTTHKLGTADLAVSVWDNSSPRKKIGAEVTVNTSTFDVVLNFVNAQSGRVVIQ